MAINGWDNAFARHVVAGWDGGEYSTTTGDYWAAADDVRLNGDLIRMNHNYRTVTGRVISGPRLLKQNVTVGDLRRLARGKLNIS